MMMPHVTHTIRELSTSIICIHASNFLKPRQRNMIPKTKPWANDKRYAQLART